MRPSSKSILPAFLLGVLGIQGSAASGATILFEVAGVITTKTDPSSLFPGSFDVGTPYTALVSYDSALAAPDSHPSSEQGNYAFPSGGLAITFSASGHSFFADTPSGDIEVFNGGGGDTLRYYTQGGLGNVPTYDGGALPGSPVRFNLNLYFAIYGASPTSILSEALPLTAPLTSAFPYRALEVTALATDFPPSNAYQFLASVTSVTSLPEPSSAVLTALGLSGLAMVRRRRQRKARPS